MIDGSNVIFLHRRPFHRRFANSYRSWREFGLSVFQSLRAAWFISRWKPVRMHPPIPPQRLWVLEPIVDRAAEKVDFDAWMRNRTDEAHREFMERTSRLPPCAPLVYPPDQIAKFYSISHGGID